MQRNLAVKKTVAYAFLLAVAGVALNAIRVRESVVKAAPLLARAVPYTVTLQDYSVRPDGTEIPTGRDTIAVRADGSKAIDTIVTADSGPGVAERILSFSSGTKRYIFENKRQTITTFAPDRYVSSHWLADPHNDCLVAGAESPQEVAGIEIVNGYRTVKLITGVVTRWLALDYGCALIKGRAEESDGQVSEKRLIALVTGEPSASLFDDPAGFQEVPPSVIFPGPDSASHDAYYYAHRPVDGSGMPQK